MTGSASGAMSSMFDTTRPRPVPTLASSQETMISLLKRFSLDQSGSWLWANSTQRTRSRIRNWTSDLWAPIPMTRLAFPSGTRPRSSIGTQKSQSSTTTSRLAQRPLLARTLHGRMATRSSDALGTTTRDRSTLTASSGGVTTLLSGDLKRTGTTLK